VDAALAKIGVHGIDPSAGYLALAREQVRDPRARFDLGDARHLSVESARHDAVVSALVLNFIPDLPAGMAQMRARSARVVSSRDTSGITRERWNSCVTSGMPRSHLSPTTWNAMTRRFPICKPGPLKKLFEGAGLQDVEVRSIDVSTPFRDFDDY
jgi:hypothetical protein